MSYRAAFFAATLVFVLATASALAATGDLTQLPGTAGCVSDTGTAGACADGKALDNPGSVAVSPDSNNVYVASSRAIAAFRRDTTTRKLTQLAGTAGCVSEDGSGGACADGKALDSPWSVAVSPDGKNVYVASWRRNVPDSHAVAVFARDSTTGELTQLPGTAGCISQNGSAGACTDGRVLLGARSVAVSPEGKNVYVAGSIGVAVLRRDTTTGALTQSEGTDGCIREGVPFCRQGRMLNGAYRVALSPDGKSAYVLSQDSPAANRGAIAVLRRNTTTGALWQSPEPPGCVTPGGSGGDCVGGFSIEFPSALAVSPDGKHVYVASLGGDAVTNFKRNSTTSALTELDCISETGETTHLCADGKALRQPSGVTVSADGRNVYVSAAASDAVAVLNRDPATLGNPTQDQAGSAGCVSETGSDPDNPPTVCADGKGLDGPSSVAASADGKSVYVTSSISDAVAVFARETPP
jgi:DNA-binding beta-propeller fold protein YncE